MQKRTRRLDKHKQRGPCIYNVRDSIGRKGTTRMAIYGLLYATIFRSETLDPKGGRQKGIKTNRLLATTRKLAEWPK